MDRRTFITLTASSFAGIALYAMGARSAEAATPEGTKRVRIVPVEGMNYPPSFLKFIEARTFAAPAEAISSVRSSRLTYRIVLV